MKVSLNVVKQFIDFDLPPVDELVAKINAQLGGVEEVIDLGAKYKSAMIVKVVKCEKHTNADKLSVCMIDVGAEELVQVVCGANNVHAGMWAVWLPPESIVPSTYSDTEPFVLGAREIRGVMSNGMLASSRELGIGDNHDGIVDIADIDLPHGKDLSAGDSFAEMFGLDDTVIDIENKMFTHRPDLFGQLGVAREIAGIFGRQFKSPEWYLGSEEGGNSGLEEGDGLPLEVFNDALEKAPRFMAVVIKGIEVKPSPLWLQCEIVAMGGKPINNIVDATNYIMLLTAQPVHAYDYSKLRGGKLGVRMAQDGEKLPLLNGKTYELMSDDIVIADAEGAIGLAGIMGGGNSEVSENTESIVLEVANFDMYTVRRSSMRHGLFTDALTRFNKGQSPLQNPVVMSKLMQVIGGKQASDVFDVGSINQSSKDDALFSQEVRVTSRFINQRLGLSLDQQEVQRILVNVEIDANSPDDHDTYFSVLPPFWRTDLELPEDIVEEVGRLYGYDKLPHELPQRSTKPAPVNSQLALKRLVREGLARAGASEVLTYSFVHERVLKSATQDVADAYQISNALSPDLQYYRLSILPSLLDKVHSNIKAGHSEFALFEIGKSHSKSAGLDEQGLPQEPAQLAFTYASRKTKDGAAYYRSKVFLEFLMESLGVEVVYEQLDAQLTTPLVNPFEKKRAAVIREKKSGLILGVIGEYKKAVTKNFKLPEYSAGFEVSLDEVGRVLEESIVSYSPLSRYPSVERDLSLKVEADVSYAKVRLELGDALDATGLTVKIEPITIYKPDDNNTKTITFRIWLTSYDRTLVSSEVNEMIDAVSGRLRVSIGAEIV